MSTASSATWEGCTSIREVGEPIDPDAIGVEPFEQVLIDRELVTFERGRLRVARDIDRNGERPLRACGSR